MFKKVIISVFLFLYIVNAIGLNPNPMYGRPPTRNIDLMKKDIKKQNKINIFNKNM